jgi:hypothetical protein
MSPPTELWPKRKLGEEGDPEQRSSITALCLLPSPTKEVRIIIQIIMFTSLVVVGR